MTSRVLQAADDYMHAAGVESNWNESRYIDFEDRSSRIGGWLRIGMRPNEGHAEMSVCLYLPDGRVAFQYLRAPIERNGLSAGGQTWHIGEPYEQTKVSYAGPAIILDDPWLLQDPKKAFTTSPRAEIGVDLDVTTRGLDAVMGRDQSHIDLIFLPGQADWHYQHLCWVKGTVTVDGETIEVDGRGGKDHSWGPRNWLAKIYLRWYTAISDDNTFGFMLVRAVGPTKKTRSGHVWVDGKFLLIDDFEFTNTYSTEAPYHLLGTTLEIRAGDQVWKATGTPTNWMPLRHRTKDEHGRDGLLRIVKSPTVWTFEDGNTGEGSCEMHDRIDDRGVPVGLHE